VGFKFYDPFTNLQLIYQFQQLWEKIEPMRWEAFGVCIG